MFNGNHYQNGRNPMNRFKAEAHRMPLFRGMCPVFFSEIPLHILRQPRSRIYPFFSTFSRELNPRSWRFLRSVMPS